MRRLSFALIGLLVMLGLGAAARQTPAPAQQPIFHAGTDLVELDVSVLDKNRKPVHGLTAKDFTIQEDGKPQRIVAFSTVDIPSAPAPTAAWMNTVAADVTSNDNDNRRLVVIVMDDATVPFDPLALQMSKKIGHRVVDEMAPDDLAAVIFTRDNRGAQDFTNDHARLHAAIDKFSFGMAGVRPGPSPPIRGGRGGRGGRAGGGGASSATTMDTCVSMKASADALKNATDYLIAVPHRRKTLIYISVGLGVSFLQPDKCGVIDDTKDMFRLAQRANVNVYPIDPTGQGNADFLLEVAGNTGGRAIVNTSDPVAHVPEIFEENSSYYLIGYESSNTKTDGTFRRLDVTVDRPGVDVRTRKNYYAPVPDHAGKAKAPAPALKALADVLPNADLPLRITAAPFAVPGKPGATVAITLGVRQPAVEDSTPEQLEVLAMAFTPEGKQLASATQTATLNLHAPRAGDDTRYETLSRIDLAPGRYELRVSAHSLAFDKRGSVFASVDVPDFSKRRSPCPASC